MILGKDPTNDDTLPAEKEYSINFTELQKKLCLSLYYDAGNSYIFLNGVETHKLKANDPQINATPSCLVNVWKNFSVIKLKKTGLYRYVFDFSVDYDSIDIDDILDIYKYLMVKNNKR